MRTLNLLTLLIVSLCLLSCAKQQPATTNYVQQDNWVEISNERGDKLRVSAYGEHIVRLQRAETGQAWLPNDHYRMVENHQWQGSFAVAETPSELVLSNDSLSLTVSKVTLAAQFSRDLQTPPILSEQGPMQRDSSVLQINFAYDPAEHFTGLGHGYFARADSLDLRGKKISRNYGSKPIEQAPLLVPFYMSSKGYGVFLNTTFANTFNFGEDDQYSLAFDDSGFNGQMDYFFINGPQLTSVLDRYTQLTGRPRLPMKSMFGLQLSDKGHDHNSLTPSDGKWWREKVTAHRQAGLPLDHLVNDNRWRASGGKRCESEIAWDKGRFPDPAAFQRWLEQQGLVSTIDFNRCIARLSKGWQPAFNLPQIDEIEFADSAPDLTNQEFQRWFWDIFYTQSLNPSLGFPGDALWIDEFDEQGAAPKDMVLANGRSSAEMRNYWFFLIAQALVEQGWDQSDINQRPYVWVRGMTAGAQRFATLWSGDIYPDYKDMQGQIRGMQLAGLAGFPFWGHDAGGFFDWDAGVGPDDNMYQRWAMAFGSFSPIWKPHGMGHSRWPLDRGEQALAAAHKYTDLRYRLMPYLYSVAHQAAETGLPMARPMLLQHTQQAEAWQYDLQYYWGPSMLVAPVTADQQSMDIWLPSGQWYRLGGNQIIAGDQVLQLSPVLDELPVFVPAGAILPSRQLAMSTAFIDKSKLILDVYAGADGAFTLFEDDDKTEAYRTKGQRMQTRMEYEHNTATLTIDPAEGQYPGAVEQRDYVIRYYHQEPVESVLVNGKPHPYSLNDKTLSLALKADVRQPLVVTFSD